MCVCDGGRLVGGRGEGGGGQGALIHRVLQPAVRPGSSLPDPLGAAVNGSGSKLGATAVFLEDVKVRQPKHKTSTRDPSIRTRGGSNRNV